MAPIGENTVMIAIDIRPKQPRVIYFTSISNRGFDTRVLTRHTVELFIERRRTVGPLERNLAGPLYFRRGERVK